MKVIDLLKETFDVIRDALFIIQGYSCWVFNIITGKTRKATIERMSICQECENNKHGICQKCGCVLKAKVRVDFPLDENGKSIGGCPENKW